MDNPLVIFIVSTVIVTILSPFIAWAGWHAGVRFDGRRQYRQRVRFWCDEWDEKIGV